MRRLAFRSTRVKPGFQAAAAPTLNQSQELRQTTFGTEKGTRSFHCGRQTGVLRLLSNRIVAEAITARLYRGNASSAPPPALQTTPIGSCRVTGEALR